MGSSAPKKGTAGVGARGGSRTGHKSGFGSKSASTSNDKSSQPISSFQSGQIGMGRPLSSRVDFSQVRKWLDQQMPNLTDTDEGYNYGTARSKKATRYYPISSHPPQGASSAVRGGHVPSLRERLSHKHERVPEITHRTGYLSLCSTNARDDGSVQASDDDLGVGMRKGPDHRAFRMSMQNGPNPPMRSSSTNFIGKDEKLMTPLLDRQEKIMEEEITNSSRLNNHPDRADGTTRKEKSSMTDVSRSSQIGVYARGKDEKRALRDADTFPETHIRPESYSSLHLGSLDLLSEGIADNRLKTQKNAVQAILRSMKQSLLDHTIEEFWISFGREWNADLRQLLSLSRAASRNGSDGCTTQSGSLISVQSTNAMHINSQGGEGKLDDGAQWFPRQPRLSPTLSNEAKTVPRFACPFYKHDPRKYNGRACSKSPWDTVSRIKEHLYRAHKYTCQRCHQSFKRQEELNYHVQVTPAGTCELRNGEFMEVITPEVDDQLKRQEKTSLNQSEKERWEEIYRLLFPCEPVPSPYFRQAQRKSTDSSKPQDLADFEGYLRRELPRLVRDHLESIIDEEARQIEERLSSKLGSIVKDCLNLVSTQYACNPRQNRTSTGAMATPLSSKEKIISLDGRSLSQSQKLGDIVTLASPMPSPQSMLNSIPIEHSSDPEVCGAGSAFNACSSKDDNRSGNHRKCSSPNAGSTVVAPKSPSQKSSGDQSRDKESPQRLGVRPQSHTEASWTSPLPGFEWPPIFEDHYSPLADGTFNSQTNYFERWMSK